MPIKLAVLAGGAALLFVAPASADELRLKNGDRITGVITSASGGSIVIEPDFAKGSKLTIALDEVATFSTAEPLVVRLKDGTELNRTAQAAEAGTVALADAGGPPLPLAEIDEINPEAIAWHGSVSVNGLYARSARTNAQIGLAADGERRGKVSRITLGGGYSYGRQSEAGVSSTTTDNWFVLGKYDYFVSPRWFAYGAFAASADKVNFLRLRYSPGVGGGYQWIDRSDFHIRTEAGASWVYEDYRIQPQATKNLSMRIAYHVDKSLDGERISLVHNLEYLPSIESAKSFLVNTDAGVRVALTQAMFSELKGKLVYDNDPAFGARKTTSEIRIGVGLTY